MMELSCKTDDVLIEGFPKSENSILLNLVLTKDHICPQKNVERWKLHYNSWNLTLKHWVSYMWLWLKCCVWWGRVTNHQMRDLPNTRPSHSTRSKILASIANRKILLFPASVADQYSRSFQYHFIQIHLQSISVKPVESLTVKPVQSVN